MEKILLIVDDSKEIIDVVTTILSDLFDKIVTAGSVPEAQKILEESVVSMIVLDINLEGRNGAEIVKFLVDNPDNKNNGCPVIILSGIINTQFAERFGSRFAGVVMKPFDHAKLHEMVKAISEGKTIEPEPVYDDLPDVKCELPFPIPQLEQRVNKIMDQVKKNTKLKQLFAELKIDRSGDNYIMSHIGMLINIATGISIKMEWNTEKTLEKFVYAAYLHDMALSERPDLAKIKGGYFELELLKEKLSPQDFKLVLEHPNIAAKKIDELKEIPPDVGMIVRQHHELPKENGYPNKLAYNKITPLATVFIVSHDLTHFILDNPKWTMKDYMAKAKMKFKGPHFAKVLSALNDLA